MDMTSATLLARTARVRRSYRPDVARGLLTLLALVPYVLGWCLGAVASAAAWTWAAAVVGWRDARGNGQPKGT